MHVIGYVDRLAAKAGERIGCHISVPESCEVEFDVVRLIHGDTNPAGPGFKIEAVPLIERGSVRASPQPTHPGSFMVADGIWEEAPLVLGLDVLVWPTTPSRGRPQGLVSICNDAGDVLALALGIDGRLELVSRTRTHADSRCASPRPLAARTWYRVVATIDTVTQTATITQQALGDASWVAHVGTEVTVDADLAIPAHASCVVGALSCRRSQGRDVAECCFNGKLERPTLTGGAALGDATFAAWRFELGVDSRDVVDFSGRNKTGHLINLPARAMTGHAWTGSCLSPEHAPEQYAAVHFHEDDLDDAGWEKSVQIDLPSELRSGVYAVRLQSDGGVDHVPFCVSPPRDQARAPVTLLLPTFTYLAYANEHLVDREPHSIALGPHDRAVAEHPEFGLSLYDRHVDGSGVCYASGLRPLLNMRPDYRSWMHDAPRHFSADLYIVDWLERLGVAYDVVTDHDLHTDGVGALGDSGVVITGSHPEYVSEPMLDALQAHIVRAGRMMYLGGNGFYWVTSQDPNRSHVIEVRRGVAGTRTWESEAGETYHSTTGEPGGLWRHRGRPPNTLTGVGFSAQLTGVRSAEVRAELNAPGFRRLPDSFRPEVAFAFEGIAKDEIVGDFGLVMNGASGDEIDRYDIERGSPPGALLLARSTGHSERYFLCSEDVLMTSAVLSGPTNDRVRSDIVLLELPGGGAVFSVGSICFTGSLSYHNYANNVARLATNVLRAFVRRSPEKAR